MVSTKEKESLWKEKDGDWGRWRQKEVKKDKNEEVD